nr:PREDICTED: uncharacterized protein LOC109041192 isoform X2 [Bemisia tabaci]
MNKEPMAMPISPTSQETSFSNLLEDVDQVKTHLDLLGLPYNPNLIANILLDYDNDNDRVNLAINKIIDEPPDVEITFEKNSPDKTSKSKAQKTALSVDLTGETSASKDTKGILNLFDQDQPSPCKILKSTNPEENPFLCDHRKNNLFKSENSPEVPLASTSYDSTDPVINISDIEEFLNSKEPLPTPKINGDHLSSLNYGLEKLKTRLDKLKNNVHEYEFKEKKLTEKVLKTATDLANEDLKTGIISPLHQNISEKPEQVSLPFDAHPFDEYDEYEDCDFSKVEEVTSQLVNSVDRSLCAPQSSLPSASSSDSVTKLVGLSGNFDKIGTFTGGDSFFKRLKKPSSTETSGSSSLSCNNNSTELEEFDNFLDSFLVKNLTSSQRTNPSTSQASTSISNPWQGNFQPTSEELAVIDEVVAVACSPEKIIMTDEELKKQIEPTKNVKKPIPATTSSEIEVIPCEPSTSGPSFSRMEVIQNKPSTSGSCGSSRRTNRTSSKTHSSSPKKATEPMPMYLANLMEIFPEADTDYLRNLCKSANDKKKFPNKDEILQTLIETVIRDESYPKRTLPRFEDKPAKDLSLNEKYQNIIAIIPNVDPEFLENKCKELTNDEIYSAFVDELLTRKNYPTIQDYERRKETEKAIQAYTDLFTIAGFLEVFPDPEDYFLNKKASSHHELSLTFLKDRYKLLRATDIAKYYKAANSNLTRTCLQLDSYNGPRRATKRSAGECRWPPKTDVNFLQEISYINHKQQIKDYIEQKKKDREEAFRKAKENNELFTCSCCFEDEVMKDDVITCPEGHVFCSECVRRSGEIKLGERKAKVECMEGSCEAEFSLKDLQKVLAPNAFSKFVKIKQTEEIKAAGIEGLVSCPFCEFASIPPPEDKIFKCQNTDCMKESCRLCNLESHIPLRCDEVERDADVKARLLIEEKMTEALARECYNCKAKFIKEDGCNKMTCGHCGKLSCYICRQPVTDYSHFNGDGGDRVDKCPLWSDNDLLHVDAVRLTAEAVKNKLIKENPGLKLKVDPTLVLPENAYKKKAAVPAHRAQQRGLVLNRVIPVDVPRDNLPPVDLKPPAPIIPPHLLLQEHANQARAAARPQHRAPPPFPQPPAQPAWRP